MQIISTHPSDSRGTNALKRALADIEAPGWAIAYGDRKDQLEAVLEAHYRGVKIVHVGGGETLHYDDHAHPDHRTRDAISMIARVHCVANLGAEANLRLLLTPTKEPIYITGCPSLDEIVAYAKTLDPDRKREGVFEWFPEAVSPDGVWTGALSPYRMQHQDFLHRIAHCALFRTNSSAGLREAPILGTPVELVGERQKGRIPGPYHHPEGKACEEIRRIVLEVCCGG